MQHYVDPNLVVLPSDTPKWPSKRLKAILEREGQIVPILVHWLPTTNDEPLYMAADGWQGERVLACRELEWPTILVEDNWEESDL